MSKKIAIAITGASSIRVGIRTVEVLSQLGYDLYIAVTNGAYEVAKYEESMEPARLKRLLEKYGVVYGENDFTSPLASSSSIPRIMIVVPASMKTVGLAAKGIPSNLVVRGMLAVLRLGGRLVVAPRESPVGTAELENLLALARMGAIIVPLCIAFYHKPKTINDIIDFLVGKILDAAGIENMLYVRWASSNNTRP